MLETLQASAVDKFLASTACQTLISSGVLGTSTESNGSVLKWVFQGSADDRPFRDPEGSGKTAIVLTTNGTWGSNHHNSARMPVLTALVYSDRSRNQDGTPYLANSKDLALTASEALISVFHDAANKDHKWPRGVWVISSVHESGPNSQPIAGTDGMTRTSITFNLQIG